MYVQQKRDAIEKQLLAWAASDQRIRAYSASTLGYGGGDFAMLYAGGRGRVPPPAQGPTMDLVAEVRKCCPPVYRQLKCP